MKSKKQKISLVAMIIGIIIIVILAVEVIGINKIPKGWTEASLNPETPVVRERIDKKMWYAPIPKGFTVLEGTTISSGLVIEDANNNQFVWIPVNDKYNITNALNETITDTTALAYWKNNVIGTGTIGSGFNEAYPRGLENWTKTEWNAMCDSVIKYGGFYVGRYETGKDSSGNPIVKAGATVWNNVEWNSTDDMFAEPMVDTATYVARNMYSTSNDLYGATSTLIYGIQWDTIMNWANCTNKTREKETYISTPSLTGEKYLDGTTYDVEKNIYDLAGNVQEWTMQAYNNNYRAIRGGGYSYALTIAYQEWGYYNPTVIKDDIGFRIALYVE